MKLWARRKVVFVIVEGASDETALGIALNQVLDKESVHVHIMHGDNCPIRMMAFIPMM